MAEINDFFSLTNSVGNINEEETKQEKNYLEVIEAVSRTVYTSIYVIDYEKKGFEYVSDNPMFLCGHTSEEVKEMGYAFYFKNVISKDLDLLLKINTIGFDFYESIPLNENYQYLKTGNSIGLSFTPSDQAIIRF